jgi:hypothetical protein
MARPLSVNLLLAGTGSVLLVSGISGKSLAEVLKGDFGKLKVNPNAGGSPEGAIGNAETAFTGEPTAPGQEPVSNREPSLSTFAPSPIVFSKQSLTPKQINKQIVEYLFARNIDKPTNRQIGEARLQVELADREALEHG